ncbi:phage regulatory protein/antirepressor Ant [Allopusillimonas soli]|uniref:Phage antirepressor KilAC domain-containing protein n=1 Tax=Allopusillimonas soli TaxID=659016 RepID=A0A853FKI8_9BURK|nr:phage antirepressor KilAC domain-containing protein [Allopusillimonas soli]NYT38891.1 phage antirepressor KilAC domain-containing protein [Allopusillimonas soli]TEA70110.1 phage regulatory protein/antirepressor Ant [Allopusillimonas soli]
MTSIEIAGLVESRHDSVKRTIERLANQGVIVQPPLVDEPGTDSMGRSRATQVYVFTGEHGKRDSIIVVAQLSPQFTARLVDRWQELERGVMPAVPQTFADALRLAAEQADQIERQQHALAEAAPKVQFVDRYATANGTQGFRQVCKLLNANEAQFRLFLLEQRIVYRLDGNLTPFQNHIDAGRFQVRTGIAHASDRAFAQMRFTPKGVTWIAGEWGKYCLAKEQAGSELSEGSS